MDKALEQEIRKLIGAGKIEKALTMFIEWAKTANSDLENNLTLQSGRLAKIKREESLALVSYGEANMTRNQITNAVLDLIDSAEVSTIESEPEPTPPKPSILPTESNIILFLASNPWNTAKLQLEKEFTKVFNNLQNSKFVVKSEFAVTPSSLQKAILKYKPRIIHFSGHGLSDSDVSTIQNPEERGIALAAKEGAGIVLQDEKGRAKVMETKNLVAMFQTFTKYKIPIDTVIFNSCHSKAQADGIRNYVNYVVGYSNAIKDDAAILIANEFYSYYAENDNVELAFDLTKNIVNVEGYSEDQLMELLKRDGL